MNVKAENDKIIISFDKMNKIGGKPVSMINKKIINIAKEKKKVIEIRNKEIIAYVLRCGNIILENKEEIRKRNEEIIAYVLRCYSISDKGKIKKYKKIIEIRNRGENDWVITTDKKMITRYKEIFIYFFFTKK